MGQTLDSINLPPCPQPAKGLEDYQRSVERWARDVEKTFRLFESFLRAQGVYIQGYGTPEGTVAAPVGAVFQRLNGGAATTLYVKESGVGTTGWAAK